jgi:hypothetical protein
MENAAEIVALPLHVSGPVHSTAMRAVLQAAHALRRPVTEVSAEDVEAWARTDRIA